MTRSNTNTLVSYVYRTQEDSVLYMPSVLYVCRQAHKEHCPSPQIGKASSYDGYSFICVLGSFALKFIHPSNSKLSESPKYSIFMPSTWL